MTDIGPWIEHDGQDMPVQRGTMVQAEYRCGEISKPWPAGTMRVDPFKGHGWHWSNDLFRYDPPLPYDIVRYRVRKPRGVTILEGLIEELPEEVPA